MRSGSFLSAGIGVVRLPQPYSVSTRRRADAAIPGRVVVGNLAGPLLRRVGAPAGVDQRAGAAQVFAARLLGQGRAA